MPPPTNNCWDSDRHHPPSDPSSAPGNWQACRNGAPKFMMAQSTQYYFIFSRFLKWGYPQIIYIYFWDFSILNHPFWATPIVGNPHIQPNVEGCNWCNSNPSPCLACCRVSKGAMSNTLRSISGSPFPLRLVDNQDCWQVWLQKPMCSGTLPGLVRQTMPRHPTMRP